MPTTRGSTASPRSTATIRGSPVSTVSSGTIALPIPAATSPCTVWLSFDRKAHRGSTRAARNAASIGSVERPERNPTSGCRAISWSEGRAFGERRSGGHDEDVRVAQQLDRVEGRIADRQQQESDVELAALQRIRDHLVVVLLQHDLDQRPLSGEPAHDLRQDAGPGGLEGADAQRARLAGPQRLQIGLRGLESRDDRIGMAEQQLTGLGQGDGPWAARPLDQLLADDPLQGRDLLADRRLGVAEPFRGPSERAGRGDRLEGGEVPQLDAEPTIRFHNENKQYHDLS